MVYFSISTTTIIDPTPKLQIYHDVAALSIRSYVKVTSVFALTRPIVIMGNITSNTSEEHI